MTSSVILQRGFKTVLPVTCFLTSFFQFQLQTLDGLVGFGTGLAGNDHVFHVVLDSYAIVTPVTVF